MNNFECIDVHKVSAMLLAGAVTIVDIRDEASYQQAHIDGAVAVNDENINVFIKETDKNRPLICYCYHGISSQSAASFFKEQGFKNVFSMTGGFEEWQREFQN